MEASEYLPAPPAPGRIACSRLLKQQHTFAPSPTTGTCDSASLIENQI
ncbi:Uncharacterised protein [Stutzerimonas stutzeri]|nr:Uncharacterised protein [Stutzerimonas stutzeri]